MDENVPAAVVHYRVKTEHFEGPLDLLLSLIEKRKLLINDFALASVADDYITSVRTFEQFPIGEVANFLIIASTLVLIKSKSILPELTLSQEEEGSIDDLKRRLALHELFRDLSQHIKNNFGKTLLFERMNRTAVEPVFAPDMRLNPNMLSTYMLDVINNLPKQVVLPKATIRKVISLEEMIDQLTKRITQTLKMSFTEFTRYRKGGVSEKTERVEIIVGFLAMLELVKQGVVHVSQHEDYGEIEIESHQLATPSYS